MESPNRSAACLFDETCAEQHAEGALAKAIEHQTAKLPSDLFLWAAGATIAASAMFHCSGRPHQALFVGQWAAPLLILGLYNKLVKIAGSDQLTP